MNLEQWTTRISDQIAAQTAAMGEKVEEARVREIVGENLQPIYDELAALADRKMQFTGGSESNQRDAALRGTRYEGLYDMASDRTWNADDVEFLHDLMLALQRGRHSQHGPSEVLRNLHEDINTRAMDTAESGYGSQLVGVGYVAQLWSGAREQSKLFALLPTYEMLQASDYLPVAAAPPEMLFVSESTASDSSNYTTSKTGSNRVSVSAVKFVIHQMWSGEMEEDSIIPYIPFLRGQAAYSLGYYTDSLVLNGDTTNAGTGNINLDDADPADTKHYLAADGIRHACLIDNTGNATDQAGAITFNALIGMRIDMLDRTYHMDWGHPSNPGDLIYVCSPEDADKIAVLDEFITVDKFGPQATVLTGQVGRVGRNPLLATIAMSLTEADGRVSDTAASNTLGQVVAFNRQGFVVGWRRRVQMKTEDIIATDQYRIVYSLRCGLGRFTPTGAASGIEAAAVRYNITV